MRCVQSVIIMDHLATGRNVSCPLLNRAVKGTADGCVLLSAFITCTLAGLFRELQLQFCHLLFSEGN